MSSSRLCSRKRAAESSSEEDEGDHTSRHLRFLSRRLQTMFNVKELSDTTFLVDGAEVYASRLVLAAANEYFRALLFGEEFKETRSDAPIEIHGVDKPTFELCLRYLYSGTAAGLSKRNALQVIKAADMFRIDALCSACVEAMLTMVDASTCLQFLVASQSLPGILKDVRARCLDYVAQSLDALFPGDDDSECVDVVKLFNLDTALRVCTRVGMGIQKVSYPAVYLKRILRAFTAWGGAYFGHRAATPQGLYKELQKMEFEDFRGHADILSEVTCEFNPTNSQFKFIKGTRMESKLCMVDGYGFKISFNTNDRASSHCGLYLVPETRSAYPEWWQCHALFQFTSDLHVQSKPVRIMFDVRDFSRSQGARGFSKFLPHTAIPEVPDSIGALASSDVRMSMKVTATLVFDSISSLFTAHNFFSSELWEHVDMCHLKGILHLDCLPVSTEDALLGKLLAMGRMLDELDELLHDVRWQFVTPAFLLEACRSPKAAAFRKCAATKSALHWLLGRGDRPQHLCQRRRTGYDDAVRDCHPVKEAALIDWLLSKPYPHRCKRLVQPRGRLKLQRQSP